MLAQTRAILFDQQFLSTRLAADRVVVVARLLADQKNGFSFLFALGHLLKTPKTNWRASRTERKSKAARERRILKCYIGRKLLIILFSGGMKTRFAGEFPLISRPNGGKKTGNTLLSRGASDYNER